MKTLFFLALILLLRSGVALTQDFRALPPAEQPNAAELAYLGGHNPGVIARQPGLEEQPDKKAIALVTGFLNDLVSSQLDAARQRLAEGFMAYGPGYDDKLETNDLLNQWEGNATLFTDQRLTIETASTTLVPNGDNRGLWVYMKCVWSATDERRQGEPTRMPFHQLTRVSHDRIERTYTSHGTDQLFYNLGFALYASPSSVVQRR